MMKKSVLAFGIVAACAVITFGGTKLWQKDQTELNQDVETAPVGYSSFEDAQEHHDATLLIMVKSMDGSYADFGLDGKPNFDGDPGLGIEYFTAHVVDVISGDESLMGQSIVVTQLEAGTVSESEAGDQIEAGKSYVIIALSFEPNPGTIESRIWSTPLAGQGVFPVFDGQVFPTNPDVFPEVFEGNSVSLDVLKTQ
ncbi:MAG: hypothetical protein QMB98_04215 [Flaviflexus sp.]|uniref:hypothetical protein n=1 Tax=Flaviflexus sp. TaxID=1969482 RepID=UPI00352DFFF3